ncbi:hypothetical protein P152DRAFT_496926 [Eremomyces bilateralis CBS 781.70]|uniref:Tc1-like transposase DDE domain-containing protein n=1 Tax=Eremomyces bilateralis CBS 781.70 TaxID=1392243 RepID=A0A6G1FSQ5_9PEZI|nr:uncharacterized protein P152DRAFT_496926 [Eremomyces bilateralis CBS 781.70]KAF1808817.1 hypothetical protein P152DRAFT_496926 [Eremomyces bilateralis CBS 781.70]
MENSKWVIRGKEERYCPNCMQHRKKRLKNVLHAWGAVGIGYKSPLVFYEYHKKEKPGGRESGLNMIRYRDEVLRSHVLPLFQRFKKEKRALLLEVDNDGCRGTRSESNMISKFMSDCGIPWYADPPQSPDMSPIENVWRILKQHLKQRRKQPTTKEDLKDAIIDEWNKIPQHEIDSYIESMPDRMEEIEERYGLQSRY